MALILQVGLGRLVVAGHRYVEVLLVPVALYAITSSQRAAMFMGCAAGLLSDTWFHSGPFGLNGFKWTLLGWALGALAVRVDLNQPVGRLVTGIVLATSDALLDVLLRGLLDADPHLPGALALLVKTLATGLLAVVAGSMLERGRRVPRPGGVV